MDLKYGTLHKTMTNLQTKLDCRGGPAMLRLEVHKYPSKHLCTCVYVAYYASEACLPV